MNVVQSSLKSNPTSLKIRENMKNQDSIKPYIVMVVALICGLVYIMLVCFGNIQHLEIVTDIKANETEVSEIQISEHRKLVNEINMVIHNAYDRTISNLNFSITFFTIVLMIAIAPVGVFSYRVWSQSKELLEQIHATPELVVENYERRQIERMKEALFDPDILERSRVAEYISKTRFLIATDYNIVLAAFRAEYKIEADYSIERNIENLLNALQTIDRTKAVSDFLGLLEDSPDNLNQSYLFNIIISSDHPEHVKRIKGILKQNKLVNIEEFMGSLAFYKHKSNNYLKYIIAECTRGQMFDFLAACDVHQKALSFKDISSIAVEQRHLSKELFGLLTGVGLWDGTESKKLCFDEGGIKFLYDFYISADVRSNVMMDFLSFVEQYYGNFHENMASLKRFFTIIRNICDEGIVRESLLALKTMELDIYNQIIESNSESDKPNNKT